MAVVWEARDEVLNRTVAVKVLAGKHLGDPQSRELIRHEAQAAAALSHPNVAQVHDYGETATTAGVFPYVVMELIRGETLLTRASQGPVTARFAMRVCAEIAAALAAAHNEGIVHRDVKPANVMLAPTGAKVVDFGIAAVVAPGRDDEDFEVLGTPAYLAPERLLSDVVEPASDVYALAILLYQLLAGCLPWTTETTTQMLTAHMYVEPVPLGPTDGVPDYVVTLCNRCLAKDPTMRPSAREVAAVLSHAARVPVATGDPTPDEARVDRAPGYEVTPPPRGRFFEDGPLAADESTFDDAIAANAVAVARRSTGDGPKSPADSPPGKQRPIVLRRWAVAAIAAVLVLAGWGFRSWGDRSVGDPQASAKAVSVRADAPSLVAGTSASARTLPTAPVPASRTTEVPASSPTTRKPTTHHATTHATRVDAPGQTDQPTSDPPTTGHPAPVDLSSDAGTVTADCPAANTAEILSASPNHGFKVLNQDSSPGPAPAVLFKHGNERVTMTITCRDSVPSTNNTVSSK